MRALPLALLIACGASTAVPPTPPPPAPKKEVPALVDLVSPLSEAGLAHAQGNDWGDTGQKPAAEVFKNATVMKDLTADRFMTAMQSMEYSLGVGCDHCHEEHNFPGDGKTPKGTARAMIKMATDIDQRFFAGKTAVTCFTCHRHDSTPEPFNATKKPEWPLPPLSDEEAKKPSKEVYKNIKILAEVPAGRLQGVMDLFSGSLGVSCGHCHEAGDWASDARPAKNRAREMLGMVRSIGETYFTADKNPVRCGTCHRGAVTPARSQGPLLVVDAALPDGQAAPRASFVVGPPTFVPPTRGKLNELIAADKDNLLYGQSTYHSTQAEVGRIPPGSYSLCTVTLPQDRKNDPRGAERSVSCAPVTVQPEPDIQTVKRELQPL